MIIQLHPQLINKIAAGEVVERPSSVVKELIENAIDANATKIDVKIKGDGTELIEIADNGEGMSREDAKIACDSHTTSKIATLADLENIMSMGFRGEALASIASVSKLTLITKQKKDKIGTEIIVNHGKSRKAKDVACDNGTIITVEHLFHKIPARKKFLKSQTTEYKHIQETFLNYALSYPHIHFTLTHDDRSVYNLPSIADDSFAKELRGRISELYPSDTVEELVLVKYNSPSLQINGYIGHPKIARSTRSNQLIFLNKRPIYDRLISKAIYDAFHTLIPQNKYPIFFIFLQINPNFVDVNVHPRKSEVRFANPGQIFNAIRQAARQALLKFVQKETKKALVDYPGLKKHTSVPKITSPSDTQQMPSFRPNFHKGEISQSLAFTKALLSSSKSANIPKVPEDMPYWKTFQVFNNFIIVEKKDKLLMIDQHAASERVTYEKLIARNVQKKPETQRLLIPEVVELTKIEFEAIKDYRKNLEKLGLGIAIFGKNAIKVEQIPAILGKSNIKDLIKDVTSDLSEEIRSKKSKGFKQLEEKIVSTMACHTSIRSGMHLEQAEIDFLVKSLLSCKTPYSCPHGRPIIWEISKYDIEKKFKRH